MTSRGSVGPARVTSGSQRRGADPLFRGTGCHLCRAKKVKCNAGKPFCERCVTQGTTDKCVYDEVKKSKYTLAKEENAILKEKVARLERELAGRSPPARGSSYVAEEDVKTPPSDGLQLIDEEELAPGVINTQAYPEPPTPYHVHAGTHYPGPSPIATTPVYESGAFPPPENYSSQSAFDHRYGNPQSRVSAPLPSSWSMPSTTIAASTSTGSVMPHSQSGQGYQPLPYMHSNDTPTSPGGTPFRHRANYDHGVAFGIHGTYRGGPIASYDVYQGAPNGATPFIVRNRPVASPPVFGEDLVMNYFQKWKADSQYAIQSSHGQASGVDAHYPGSGWEVVGNWWEKDDLPVRYRDHLIELFLPYRNQVGLEIWVPDFLASLHNPPQSRPHPGLMWMLYTFAAHFSGDPELQELVPEFMKKARSNLEQSLAKSDRLFNYVQGMTLFASMLYMQGKVNEGHIETNVACHAAILCGLHKISSPDWVKQLPPERSALRIRQIDFGLAPAKSPREHGERIAAFWQLVIVDHSAAAATGLPAMFRDDGDERSRVETVFPRPLEEYMRERGGQAEYATLRDVFAPRFIPTNPPDTVSTLQVKSTALLERAVRLGTRWRDGEDISLTNPAKYEHEYQVVLHAIQHFRQYLPPLTSTEPLPRTSNGLAWERLYPHFMTLNAQIQLYYVIADTNHEAYNNCLASARLVLDIIQQLTDDEIALLGVMPGQCFSSVSHVLTRELKARRSFNDEAGADYVNRELDIVLKALAVLGKEHHLLGIQSTRAHKDRVLVNAMSSGTAIY